MIVSQLVRQLLQSKPQARNSDRYLIMAVWHLQGLELSPEQRAKFMEVSSPETIRRIRQKIQEAGEYPADHVVHQERSFKAMQMEQIAPAASPNYIAQTLDL